MKTQTILIGVISALLVSCGESGTSFSVIAPDAIEPDDGVDFPDISPLIPEDGLEINNVDVLTGDVLPPLAISELFGQFSLTYGFTGSEQRFILTTPFSASDVRLANDGREVLIRSALSESQLTSVADIVEGDSQSLSCLIINEINHFLCVADVGGRMESLFLFAQLSAGTAFGDWKFCNGAENCAEEFANPPNPILSEDGVLSDGPLFVRLTPPEEASARSLELDQATKTDLLPYLQYHEQGTNDSNIIARSSTSEASAIAEGVMTLRESFK